MLAEIINNLKDRIQEAKLNGWLGEVQGLETSLKAAAQKLFEALSLVVDQERSPPVGRGFVQVTLAMKLRMVA